MCPEMYVNQKKKKKKNECLIADWGQQDSEPQSGYSVWEKSRITF